MVKQCLGSVSAGGAGSAGGVELLLGHEVERHSPSGRRADLTSREDY